MNECKRGVTVNEAIWSGDLKRRCGMREIRFRGKRIDNGAWEAGSLVVIRSHCSDKQVFIADEMTGYHTPVDPSTVGQYTGLKDKNGMEIYEGDIAKIPDDYNTYGLNAGEAYEVYFAHGGFRLKPKYNSLHKGYWLEDDGEFSIIGNIYD